MPTYTITIAGPITVTVTTDDPPPPPPPPDPEPSTIADLPAEVLLFWSGRDRSGLKLNTDGTGDITGLADDSLVAYMADLSASSIQLTQATSGSRPIAGYSALGRGFAIFPDGNRYLSGVSSLAGGRYLFAAVTFIGSDVNITSELPTPFASAGQALVTTSGATDADHSHLIGVSDDSLWVSGSLSGPSYVDGVNTVHVGRWYKRRVVQFDRSSDSTTGALLLLRDFANALPSKSWLHEIIILSNLATPEQIALVQAYMDYHKATPTVACTLDSLTAGYSPSGSGMSAYLSVPHKLARRRWRGCVSVPNLGVVGQGINTAITGDPAKLDSVEGTGTNILVLNGGANDIAGVDENEVWTRLKNYKDMAVARGWQVVVCSVSQGSYWGTIGKTAAVSNLRDIIAANWAAEGFAGFADIWTAATTNFDGLHYDDGGSTTAADVVGAAVDPLL